MGGLLVASILSGRAISKLGRYRAFPIAGTALISVGMWLLSRIDVSTSYLFLSAAMAVLGLGLGLVMPVLVLAVQNAVPPSDLGTATSARPSSARSAASFGVAIFGTIFANRLAYWLPRDLPASAHLSTKAAGALLHSTPAKLKKLPPAVHTGLIDAFSSSLHTVFLSAVPFGIAGFLVSLLLREVPLRETGAAPWRRPPPMPPARRPSDRTLRPCPSWIRPRPSPCSSGTRRSSAWRAPSTSRRCRTRASRTWSPSGSATPSARSSSASRSAATTVRSRSSRATASSTRPCSGRRRAACATTRRSRSASARRSRPG